MEGGDAEEDSPVLGSAPRPTMELCKLPDECQGQTPPGGQEDSSEDRVASDNKVTEVHVLMAEEETVITRGQEIEGDPPELAEMPGHAQDHGVQPDECQGQTHPGGHNILPEARVASDNEPQKPQSRPKTPGSHPPQPRPPAAPTIPGPPPPLHPSRPAGRGKRTIAHHFGSTDARLRGMDPDKGKVGPRVQGLPTSGKRGPTRPGVRQLPKSQLQRQRFGMAAWAKGGKPEEVARASGGASRLQGSDDHPDAEKDKEQSTRARRQPRGKVGLPEPGPGIRGFDIGAKQHQDSQGSHQGCGDTLDPSSSL